MIINIIWALLSTWSFKNLWWFFAAYSFSAVFLAPWHVLCTLSFGFTFSLRYFHCGLLEKVPHQFSSVLWVISVLKKNPTTLTSCCWQRFFFIIFYSAAALAWLIDWFLPLVTLCPDTRENNTWESYKEKKQLSLYLAYFANGSTFLHDFFVIVCRDHLFFIFYWAWINRTVLRGVRNCWGVWLENKCTYEGKAF